MEQLLNGPPVGGTGLARALRVLAAVATLAAAPLSLGQPAGSSSESSVRLEFREAAFNDWGSARVQNPDDPVPWTANREFFPKWRLRLQADVRSDAGDSTVGLRLGALDIEFPLRRGRYRGRRAVGSGTVRLVARARNGTLRLRVREDARTPPAPLFSGEYIGKPPPFDRPLGPCSGLHPVYFRVGGYELHGAIGIVGELEWDWSSGRERLSMEGAACFPRAGYGPEALQVLQRGSGPWDGRVRGQFVSTSPPNALGVRVPSGIRVIEPILEDGWTPGDAVADSPGVWSLDTPDGVVMQTVFDVALPEVVPTGVVSVSAYFSTNRSLHVRRDLPGQRSEPSVQLASSKNLLVRYDDGTVRGSGPNDSGELGIGSRKGMSSLARTRFDGVAKDIACAGSFSVILDGDGQVWESGTRREYEFDAYAYDWRVSRVFQHLLPHRVDGLENIVSVAAGREHAIALDDQGRVFGLSGGLDPRPAAGCGSSIGYGKGGPGQVLRLPEIRRIAAGERASAAIDRDGRIWVWGYHYLNAEEIASNAGYGCLRPLEGFPPAFDVFCGHGIAALDAGGGLWIWSDNANGEMGNGTTEPADGPQRVEGLGPVVDVVLGDSYVFALCADGTLWSWGRNCDSQLGDGTTVSRTVPGRVPDLHDVVSISGGTGDVFCLLANGTIWRIEEPSQWGSSTDHYGGECLPPRYRYRSLPRFVPQRR